MRTSNKEPDVELLGDILGQTDKAIRFKFKDDDDIERTEWFPLSQISQIHHEDPARLFVSAWIYGQKKAAWRNK